MDNTDSDAGQMLLDKGVPKKDMVISFHAPYMRLDVNFSSMY